MAGWLTHLRTAESCINVFNFSLDAEKYYIGAIAADCGEVLFDENGKKYYNPPRYISHWTDNIPDWDAPIHYERFYDVYIKNEVDNIKRSFYLGYYIHLLTDAIWIELVSRPVIESFKTPQEYSKIARNQLRNDWYHTEVVFLQKCTKYFPLEIIKKVKNFENIYLEYASTKEINEKIKLCANCYNLTDVNEETKFPYFTYENYEKIMAVINRMIKITVTAR